jgi:enamine deaminase RidA (YjgF/YER057c/UK114 family)
MTPYQRLEQLGLTLAARPTPVGNYVPVVREGNLLFLSGQGPREGARWHTGKVGAGVSVQEAHGHARLVGLNLLAVMHGELGDLGRVKRVLKLLGMVNAVPEFGEHPAVINGCSDLFVDVFGEAGRHARSAVGMGSLPMGITVEIEAVVAVA